GIAPKGSTVPGVPRFQRFRSIGVPRFCTRNRGRTMPLELVELLEPLERSDRIPPLMNALKHPIGRPAATALVVGTIIGSSIFVQASELTTLVPHPVLVVLAWAVAGVLTLIGALVCAQVPAALTRTG